MEELAALPLPTEEILSEVTKHQEQTQGCINQFCRVLDICENKTLRVT